VWYVDNQAFWLDIKIIWKTIKVVFAKKDISPPHSEIMERFLGVAQIKVKSDKGVK
jgi:undecaprenyl phosphate N,N'-diacetylbacillosamine 1-phosphate transferase